MDRIHFVGGILDGVAIQSPQVIEKVILQTVDDRVHRYEYDQDMADDKGEYARLVPTNDWEQFDAEFKDDTQP